MNTILDFLSRRFDLWVPSYIASAPARAYSRYMRRDKLTHIMFLICDHFEPRNKIQSEEQPATRMRVWQEEYGKFQKRCITEFGHGPLHSWFYPPHHGSDHLPTLSSWVFNGWGEVELHYHHDNDTADSLRVALSTTLLEYNKWGLLLQTGMSPTASFGFIHGDWALANSCDGRYCGVNEELKILQELGCWGDFTMPSANKCQTRKINSIYYASGSPLRPKSHNTGVDAQVGMYRGRAYS